MECFLIIFINRVKLNNNKNNKNFHQINHNKNNQIVVMMFHKKNKYKKIKIKHLIDKLNNSYKWLLDKQKMHMIVLFIKIKNIKLK